MRRSERPDYLIALAGAIHPDHLLQQLAGVDTEGRETPVATAHH